MKYVLQTYRGVRQCSEKFTNHFVTANVSNIIEVFIHFRVLCMGQLTFFLNYLSEILILYTI